MVHDVAGSLFAVFAFAAMLFAPGYVLAYAVNIFGFRRMEFPERSLWAVTFSFCIAPVLAYFVGRSAGLGGLAWLFGAFALLALLLLLMRASHDAWPRRDRLATALVVCGWTLFVLLMLMDVQVGKKLYFSVVMADQSYRIAFTDAVVRTGIPPANPLYFAGAPSPMRYYYFWYVLCAAVVRLAHVTARQAFIASSIWAGFGLMATVALYTRCFFRWGRRQRWIALGLLAVMGAGLVPSLGNAILQPALNGDIEWWSVDPIAAWPDSLLWVPHHVASVLCCLIAFLLLWRTQETSARRDRLWAIVIAALACASAFGLSIYVAFGFALLMIAWCARLAVLRHTGSFALLRRAALIGALSTSLLLPFLCELAGHGSPHAAANGHAAAATHMFSFSVRRMIDSGLLTGLPLFASWNQSHPVLLDQTIRLLLLLPGLAMELGLYGAVLVLLLMQWRKHALPADPARDTSLFFTVCGLLMVLFLSSSVMSNNDFGYRAVMLPQFFLLLLAADVLGSWWFPESVPVVPLTRGRRRLMNILLTLGIAGTICGSILLRAWMPYEMHRPQDGFSQLPDDAYSIRTSFAELDRVSSRKAVVVFRPIDPDPDRGNDVMSPSEFYQRMLVMDAGRQMLNAERPCATQFGGDPSACPAILQQTAPLYALPSPSAEWARSYCSQFGVQYIAVSHRDPDWGSNSGWPVALPVIAQQDGFKILRCAPDPR